MTAAYDHVIVGAGTAGCVLAARLSEDPERRVLLLEAGPDYPTAGEVPAALRDSYSMPLGGWDWGLLAGAGAGRQVGLPVGKVVGGTSRIGGSGAWRPRASDFNAWAALQMPGWSYGALGPYFNAIEADQQFGGRPWHGNSGPLPVTRWGENELLAPMRGWVQAVRHAGYPSCEDMNAPDATGVGINPQSRRGRERVSAADAYLGEEVRRRGNLEIRAATTVRQLVLERDRVVGVVADAAVLRAREVLVCAGVPLSPALLMRSGIGPVDVLEAAGVAPAVELPGVGTRVMEQPAVILLAVPTGSVDHDGGPHDEPFLQVAARLSGFPGFDEDHGFYLCLFNRMPVDEALAPLVRADHAHWLIVSDLAPASRGTITIQTPDPEQPPICDLRFYEERTDLERMRAGLQAMWEIAKHPAFSEKIDRIALATERMIADELRLDGIIRGRTVSRQPWGGCPMGPPSDPGAVVDEACRVHGVESLRVVDASIVPVPLRAGGTLVTLALAERIAAEIRGTEIHGTEIHGTEIQDAAIGAAR